MNKQEVKQLIEEIYINWGLDEVNVSVWNIEPVNPNLLIIKYELNNVSYIERLVHDDIFVGIYVGTWGLLYHKSSHVIFER